MNYVLREINRQGKDNSLNKLAQSYENNEDKLDSKPFRTHVDNFIRHDLYCQQQHQDVPEFS